MTHSLDSLIEFRRKLVRAKEISAAHQFEWVAAACHDAGIDWTPYENNEIWNWYQEATTKQRIAMWDNSIRNVDRMIEELK